jgi:hypothetical protein
VNRSLMIMDTAGSSFPASPSPEAPATSVRCGLTLLRRSTVCQTSATTSLWTQAGWAQQAYRCRWLNMPHRHVWSCAPICEGSWPPGCTWRPSVIIRASAKPVVGSA